jgi:hypothetical protein
MPDRAALRDQKRQSDHDLVVHQVARSKLKLLAGTGSIADRGSRRSGEWFAAFASRTSHYKTVSQWRLGRRPGGEIVIAKGEWPANHEGKQILNRPAVGAGLLTVRASERSFAKVMDARVKLGQARA